MPDQIRAMTAQLADDPASLVFLALGEALRQRGRLDAARAVAHTGLSRHPGLADAHDLLARIECDRGVLDEAFDLWAAALRIEPEHPGGNKGIGFLYFKAGHFEEALAHLSVAARLAPGDAGLARALQRVRGVLADRAAEAAETEAGDVVPPPPVPAAPVAAPVASPIDEPEVEVRLFAGVEGADDGLLLLDLQGLRLGGALRTARGDVADVVAAQLAGVSREAARAGRLLGLGSWRSLVAEGEDGNLHIAQPTADTVLLTLRDPGVPAGRLALVAERAARTARIWLEALG